MENLPILQDYAPIGAAAQKTNYDVYEEFFLQKISVWVRIFSHDSRFFVRVCLSIGWSVGWLDGSLVGLFQTQLFGRPK